MEEEIKLLVDDYYKFLSDQTKIIEITDGWIKIVTPCLDVSNDYIHIYVKKQGIGNYIISDHAYILKDLDDKLYNKSIKLKLKSCNGIQLILNGFNINLSDDGELVSHATKKNFSIRMHFFIQGLLAISHNFSY